MNAGENKTYHPTQKSNAELHVRFTEEEKGALDLFLLHAPMSHNELVRRALASYTGLQVFRTRYKELPSLYHRLTTGRKAA